jgi:hypothetical protein
MARVSMWRLQVAIERFFSRPQKLGSSPFPRPSS